MNGERVLGQTGGMGSIRRLLVANRGEVALRILRAAAELDIETVAVHAEDDGGSLALRRADRAATLRGTGPAAYLDAEQLVTVAAAQGCDAVHPGYGFLAEQAAFAERCRDAGLVFVGPEPETLAVLGDKVAARALAADCGLAVLPGTEGPTTPDEAHAFLTSLGERGLLGEEAVAGMDSVAPLLAGHRDKLLGVQVGRGAGPEQGHRAAGSAHRERIAVILGMDGDRLDVELGRGAEDAQGHLPAVGHEQPSDAPHAASLAEPRSPVRVRGSGTRTVAGADVNVRAGAVRRRRAPGG